MYYSSSKNKGADQLRSYCKADLSMFSPRQKSVFFMTRLISKLLINTAIAKVCKNFKMSVCRFVGVVAQRPSLQLWLYEPRREKTGLRGFRLGLTQTGLYSHRKELEA